MPSKQALHRQRITKAVEESHAVSHGVYGSRKVHQDVIEQEPCCIETVRKIMREQGLRSVYKRKFTVTTDSTHTMPIAPNTLGRAFDAEGPNQKWVADITYIETREGWLYLAVVMDLWSRRIVGWATSQSIDTRLVCAALDSALLSRRPGSKLLHHSDRGSQYASWDYRQQLALHGVECSMSRRGNCWDNACIERFFRSLKTEWIRGFAFGTAKHAHSALFEYIEAFYNSTRRHATLNYLSPVEFEARALKLTGQMA